MIIRIQGPADRRKIELDENETLQKIIETNYNITEFKVSTDRSQRKSIDASKAVGSLGLESGTLIFLHYDVKSTQRENAGQSMSRSDSAEAASRTNSFKVQRKRDPLLCNHAENAMCAHCAPLDPWDSSYHAENKIKYLSLKSYVEMLKINKKAFERPDYRKKTCLEHGSHASCTKCQSKPIVLCPQVFRVVDHVEFDCGYIVENFIRNCKTTGKTRFGYMVGKYEDYVQIPLGLKAVVSWIYEPNQKAFPDGFVLEEDDSLKFASVFEMEMVGIVYYAVGKRDFFLSSLEIEFIAQHQLKFQKYKEARTGQGSAGNPVQGLSDISRLVTIVVKLNEVDEYVLEEYMVTEQCLAMVQEGLVVPTVDPHFFQARENVHYQSKDGIVESKRVPVDFFIVRMTHGMKHNPFFLSKKRFEKSFGMKKIADYFNKTFDVESFSNYDLILRLSREMDVSKLICAVSRRDEVLLREFLEESAFSAFRERMRQYEVESWSCSTCTYLNTNSLSACEMCGIPK